MSSKIMDIVFEEERLAASVSIVLEKIDDTGEPNQPLEADIEMPFRRSQMIRRPKYRFDYVYLHEIDFYIGQANNPDSSKEVFCSESNNQHEEWKSMQDNDI